jgi:hypothetical protein
MSLDGRQVGLRAELRRAEERVERCRQSIERHAQRVHNLAQRGITHEAGAKSLDILRRSLVLFEAQRDHLARALARTTASDAGRMWGATLAAYWSTRGAEYRQLAVGAQDADVRKLLDDMIDICDDLVRATDAASARRPERARRDLIREESVEQWRIKEAECRLMARASASAQAKLLWDDLAYRCARVATYLADVPGKVLGGEGLRDGV